MSSLRRKRKLEEGSDDYSAAIEAELASNSGAASSNKRHTIDSDEEDADEEEYNKKKYNVMDEEDIEGQEASTIEFDGETKITPFNMKDELEEGYFDAQGTYVWNKKDASEIKDSWLDSIDWVKVKRPENLNESKPNDDNSESEEGLKPSDSDVLELYRRLLKFLHKGESVLKAVKRLGGSKQLSASERLKQKKLQKLKERETESSGSSSKSAVDKNTPEAKGSQSEMEKLTEVANDILSATGNMDIYQETYESIQYKIHKEEAKERSPEAAEPVPMKEDDGSDMFGDDF